VSLQSLVFSSIFPRAERHVATPPARSHWSERKTKKAIANQRRTRQNVKLAYWFIFNSCRHRSRILAEPIARASRLRVLIKFISAIAHCCVYSAVISQQNPYCILSIPYKKTRLQFAARFRTVETRVFSFDIFGLGIFHCNRCCDGFDEFRVLGTWRSVDSRQFRNRNTASFDGSV